MSTLRPTQLSMVDGMDRPTGVVPRSVMTGTNADLIAAVAPLYLTGSVLDVTYGRGKWWERFTPDPFTFHDLALDSVDFRALPEAADSFDAVCFDPPYVPVSGTPTHVDAERHRSAFGLVPRTRTELDRLIAGGLAECARVARTWLLVKCGDYTLTGGGPLVLGHYTVLREAERLRLKVQDLVVHASGTGPGGHNITTIRRARRAHSYLLVFTPGVQR